MTTYNEKSTDAAVNISSDDFEKSADATENNKSTDPTEKSKPMDATEKGKVRILQAKAEVDNTEKSQGMDKEIFCDPCQRNNKYKIAEGFCVDCDEHLCSSCFNIHKTFRVLQHHVLVDKNSVQENQTGNVKDICVDRCLSHTDRVIEYFCQSCDKLCCSVCIIKGHRHCETVDFIPDIVENIEHSKVFLDVNETIHNQSVLLAEQGEKCKINQDKRKKLKDSAKEDVKTKCQEIRDWLNKNEIEMERKIETKYTEQQQRFDMVSNEVTHLTNDLEKAKLSLTTKKNSSQRCQLFVALQKAKLTTKKVYTRLQELEKIKTIQNYRFKEAPFLQDVKKHTELGMLEEIKSDTKKNIKFLYSFDTGLEGNPGRMCMMYDNILLLQNYSIMMLDPGRTQQQILSELKLNSTPADITKISQREVAVTFPDDGVITIFDVTPEGQIKEKQKIDAGRDCHGIQYFKKSFIVTYCHTLSGSIKIIDMSGHLIKELVGSSPLVFQLPIGLALNQRSGILYVSDNSDDTVTSLTLDSTIINVYKCQPLYLYGVSLDENGSVYVCACCLKEIHQLSDKCSLVQILEIEFKTYLHVLFSETNNLMYVSTYHEGIMVFK
ncbi:uncharacterized protein LOC132721335, partial [Ruditapes philippinarum]|uniref:uncharacterized protein LOC132721335 n=1 Tax=Ruditapes philippinarum TaxID=129788 RepID=UPI00295B7E9E